MQHHADNTFLPRALFISLLVLFLSACSNEESTGDGATTNAKAVLISTSRAEAKELPIWLETVGQVHSLSAPTLAAEVEGRITRITADTGDHIEIGQLLAETDTSTLLLRQQAAQASLERLEVHIANGKRRVDRLEKLSSKNLSSQTQLDDATEQWQAYQADYKAAVAQLAIVEDSLNKSRVIAPVSGVVQRRFITTGDFVKRGQALFEITRTDLLQAWLPYPETVALRIQIGQPAKIYSPLTPGVFAPGKITELQPTIGNGSRAVMAIVDLENPGDLRPGATLSGQVLVETRRNAVMVPNLSVVRRPAGQLVYVINGDKAEARLVETGHNDAGFVEITSGLKGGETVATDGAAFLTDGASVKIAEPVS
ncbi:MAG: efflux RND transporter periplasmic adaptor subunit [Xanthomonadales bacterium]|nr:efflux RND transporter periplasmic adaptor subunit [Xanthomonadales bacterium]